MKYYRLSWDGAVKAELGSEASELLNIEMRLVVDGGRLTDAVAAALEYHPRYRTKLGNIAGQFYLAVNDDPVPVYELGAGMTGGGSAQSGATDMDELKVGSYLWACTYTGNRVTFAISEILGTAASMMPFVRDVLRLYLGVEKDLISVVDGKLDPWTVASTGGSGSTAGGPTGVKRKPEVLRRDVLARGNAYNYIYQFEFNSGLVGEMCSRVKVSAACLFSSIASIALARAARIVKGYIDVNVDVDLRAVYNCYSDMAFNVGADLWFDVAGYREQFFGYGARYMQRQLGEFIRRDSLDCQVSRVRRKGGLATIATAPLAAWRKGRRAKAKQAAVINYRHLGNIGFSSVMCEHIASIYYTGQASDRSTITLQANDYGERTYLRVAQSLTSDSLIREIEDILRESKIPYKLNIFPGHPEVKYMCLYEEEES